MNPSPLYRSRQYQNIDANKGGYSTVVPSRRLRASSVDPRRPIPLPPRRNVVTSQSVYTNPSLPRQQLYYPQLKPPLQPTHKSTPVRTSTKPQTLYTVYSTDRLLSTQNSHNNCSYGPARYRMAAERSSYGHEKEWLPRSSSVTKFSSSSFPVGETYGSRLSRDSRSHDQQSWSPKKFAYNDLPKHVSYLTLYDNGPSDAVAGSRTPTYHAQQRHSRPREDSPESRRRSQSSFYRSPSPTNANNISVASSYDQTSSDARVGHVLSSSAGLVGLSNLGNTCFMNSVLQCLSHTWELLRVCLDRTYQSELNVNSTMKGSLFVAYADLMRQMWTPSNSTTAAATPTTSSSSSSISAFPSYVTPQNFRAKIQRFAPRFMGYAQQDAQEFLRYLVQGLHEDVNRVTKRPPSEIPNYDEEDRMPDSKKAILYWNRYKRIDDSLIADIFLGQLMSTLECMSCGHKSTTFDPFWDLSLPIPRVCFGVFPYKMTH
uniref:ubiquitinyl hydrolase 1 n=1 Tax=Mesocestoides corti TaxID=53468 RepID=A0A5K3FAQ7_MESCO